MTEKPMRWPRTEAEKVAQGLLSILRPACHRIEIAGSLRRLTDDVGDIELLCISKTVGNELFGAHPLLDQEILALINDGILTYRLNSRGHRNFGPKNKLLVHKPSGVSVDVFSTTVANWGMALLVRTGPKDWNIKVMSQLRRNGMRGHAYGGVTDRSGQEVTCPTEEDVFKLLGWNFVKPEHRS